MSVQRYTPIQGMHINSGYGDYVKSGDYDALREALTKAQAGMVMADAHLRTLYPRGIADGDFLCCAVHRSLGTLDAALGQQPHTEGGRAMRRETIITSCEHHIPAGAPLLLASDRLVKVVSSTRHTVTLRDFYSWENAWASFCYRVRQAWRWMATWRWMAAWAGVRRTVRRARSVLPEWRSK